MKPGPNLNLQPFFSFSGQYFSGRDGNASLFVYRYVLYGLVLSLCSRGIFGYIQYVTYLTGIRRSSTEIRRMAAQGSGAFIGKVGGVCGVD